MRIVPVTSNALLTLLCAAALGSPLVAQGQEPGRGGRRGGGERGPVEVHEPPADAGIAWFGTWDAALAEAKRTGRPILFQSAAPQCQNVPGVW